MGIEDFRISIYYDQNKHHVSNIIETLNTKYDFKKTKENDYIYRSDNGVVEIRIEKKEIQLRFAIGSKKENIYLFSKVSDFILNNIGQGMSIKEDDDQLEDAMILPGDLNTKDKITEVAQRKRMAWVSVFGENDAPLSCDEVNELILLPLAVK